MPEHTLLTQISLIRACIASLFAPFYGMSTRRPLGWNCMIASNIQASKINDFCSRQQNVELSVKTHTNNKFHHSHVNAGQDSSEVGQLVSREYDCWAYK